MFARKYPIVPWRTPLRSACLTALSQAPLGGASYCYAIFDVPFWAVCATDTSRRRRRVALAWRALSNHRGRRRGQRELLL